MKNGTRVSWLATGASVRGYGVTITDEEFDHIQVAVDQGTFEHIPIWYQPVIYCRVDLLIPQPMIYDSLCS